MATTFDEEEFADIAETGGYGEPDEAPEAPLSASELEDEVDSQMNEAEYRLEIASYYKMLLNNTIFEGAENQQAAEVVEGEIRGFVRERLAALLGVAIKSQGLSPTESKLLKLLADEQVITSLLELVSRLLKKPSLIQGAKKKLADLPNEEPSAPPAPRSQPKLRRVVAQKAPAAKPEVPVKPVRSGKREVENPEVREVTEAPRVTGRKGKKAQVKRKVTTQGVDKDGNPVEIEIEQDLTRQTMTPKNSPLQPTPFVGATSPEFDTISSQHAAAALKIIDRKMRPALGGG